MKQLKILIYILLSIIFVSCDFINKPENGNFWERAGKPPINTQVIAVANNGDIWAANPAEIYLSTNNGNTWTQKSLLPSSTIYINSVAITPINGHVFVATYSHGMLRSTDNGENWTRVASYADLTGILFTSTGEIYLRGKGLYYSSDNGNTWAERIKLPTNDGFSIFTCFAVGTDGTLYLGTNAGVFRSTDGGITLIRPSNYNDVGITCLTISGDGSIFATAGPNYRLLKSTDRGVTWTHLTNINATGVIYNPITEDIFVSGIGGYSGIYRSSDLGENWELENNGLQHQGYSYLLLFNPNTGQMYAYNGGNSASFYRSKNYPK
jgi:photosystem II stability/assembly factor-like uncharacterized protein